MPSKKTSNTQSKSDFIRSQPPTLSAAEIVAKAKAAGIRFSPQLVYNVRGGLKPTKGTAKKTSAAKPGAAVARSSATASKADFVRSHSTLSAQEIVTRAKAQGLKLDASYVYNVRGYDKTAAKKKRASAQARATARNGAPVPKPITARSSAEDLLRAVAAEIGLARAVEILAGERARVRALIGG